MMQFFLRFSFTHLFLCIVPRYSHSGCSDTFLSCYNYIFAILSGGGKKGVAIRPYPSPGPLPFIPNAFIKCGTLTGSDSCWAASRKRECKLGEEFLRVKKYLRLTQNLFSTKKPNTNRSPAGLRTYKRRLWVEGMGPRDSLI